MRIIKTKKFAKWADKNDLFDLSLKEAAEEINSDIYDANYGGGVIKKRVATKGRGKSSSTRTIVAFKKGKIVILCLVLKKAIKTILVRMRKKL